MRNILGKIPKKDKQETADEIKTIWQTNNEEICRKRAKDIYDKYHKSYKEAMNILMDGLDDTLVYCSIKTSNYRRITSTNCIERLNREIRRRTRVVGIFPNIESYIRLVTIYLIEYMEDWSEYKYLLLTKE